MSPTNKSNKSSQPTVMIPADAIFPFWYRLVLTTIEPLCTILGCVQLLSSAAGKSQYISVFTRNGVAFAPDTSFLYTQLTGAWLVFVFNGAVMLRVFNDARVWRAYCMGMLLSDIAYAHSTAQAVGGWAVWLRLNQWEGSDWLLFVASAPFLIVRALVVLGVGVREL
jgi:hypothetical protein